MLGSHRTPDLIKSALFPNLPATKMPRNGIFPEYSMPTNKASRDDPETSPRPETILALGPYRQAAPKSIDPSDEIIWHNSVDTVLDWLWERGDDVSAIAIPRKDCDDLNVYHLVDIIERDWPRVKIIWYTACPAERGEQPGSVYI